MKTKFILAKIFTVTFAVFGMVIFASHAQAGTFNYGYVAAPQAISIPSGISVTISAGGAAGGHGDYWDEPNEASVGFPGDEVTGTFTMAAGKNNLYVCVGQGGKIGGTDSNGDYTCGSGGAPGWQTNSALPMPGAGDGDGGYCGVTGGGGGGGATVVSYNADCSSPFIVAKGGGGGDSADNYIGGGGGGTNSYTGFTLAAGSGGQNVYGDSGENGFVTVTYVSDVTGSCGTANGQTNLSAVPNGTAQCAAGTPSATNFTAGTSPTAISWTCLGSGTGGNSPTCSASVNTYSVTPSVGAGSGTITPNTAQNVFSNATQSFTLTPAANSYISSVGGTCGGTLSGTTYTTNAITANCTVVANFAIQQFTLTASAGTGGTIGPGTTTVNYGANQTFTITPSGSYVISQVAVDGVNQGAISSYTFNNVTANHTISAMFATAPGAPTGVTAIGGNTQATVSWTAPSNNGSVITSYIITPYIGAVAQTPTTITGNPPATSTTITGLTNGTVYTFKVTAVNAFGTGSQSTASNSVTPQVLTVTVNIGSGGTVKDGATTLTNGQQLVVADGSDKTLTVTQDSGYTIAHIFVNGAEWGTPPYTSPYSLALTNITVSKIVEVNFDTTHANSATFDSAIKNFSGISSPTYGNITWAADGVGSYLYQSKWGISGSGDGQLSGPKGIAVDSSGNEYILDSYQRVQKFSSTGTFITKWGAFGSGDGQFNTPKGIAIDSSGNVYVTDNNQRVQKFSSTGTFITKWGSSGSGDGQFTSASGIAVDSSGNVYVVDSGANNRVQKFSSTGTFITKWGAFGSGDGQFNTPNGIAVDSSGNVYVTDVNNHRVQKFSSTGTFITKWGSLGSGDGQFNQSSGLSGIAVDSSGNVFVTDEANKRVQKFSSTGTFITKWGSSGSGDGQFNNPSGVVIDSPGNVYVTDVSNNRVQKFSLSGIGIKMRVRTGTTADGSGSSWHNWSDSCNVNNGQSIGGGANPCVHDGDQYVQYEAILSTDSGTNVPSLGSVTITTRQGGYSQSYVNLLSSPFDSGDTFNSVQNVEWTASNDANNAVVFQIRTAPDNGSGSPAWENGSGWCGPNSCGATPGGVNDYYTVSAGNTINSVQADRNADRWLQYAAFLKSPDGGTSAPTLSQVKLTYNFNTPPIVNVTNYTQNATNGRAEITYTVRETKGPSDPAVEQNKVFPKLFYQPQGVTIQNAGALANADTNTASGTVVLNASDTNTIPSSGTMLVDNELMTFTASGANITITARHVGFNGNQYMTVGAVHATNIPVYFLATSVTGSGIGEQAGVNENDSAAKYMYWDAKSEPNTNLSGKYLSGMTFKVAANDADTFNPVGSGTRSGVVDLKSPLFTTSDGTSAASVKNDTINVSVSDDSAIANLYYGYSSDATCNASDTIDQSFSNGQNFTISGDHTDYLCAKANDAFGNVSYQTIGKLNTDNTPPLAPVLSPISTDGFVNNSEKNAIVVSGTAETNALVNATLIDSQGHTKTGNQQLSGGATNFSITINGTTAPALVDGTVTPSVTATDVAGNVSNVATTPTALQDSVKPTAPGKPSLDHYINNSGNQTISWDASTDAASGVKEYNVYRKISGGSYNKITTLAGTSYTDNSSLAEGNYYYKITAVDNAGNESNDSSDSNILTVDKTAPLLSYFTSTHSNSTSQSPIGGGSIDIIAVYNETLDVNATHSVSVKLGNVAGSVTNVTLNAIYNNQSNPSDPLNGKALTGSFDVVSRAGYDTTPNNLGIDLIAAEDVFDAAGNRQQTSSYSANTAQDLSQRKSLVIDTTVPTLTSFTIDSMRSGYKEGDTFTLNANYNKNIKAGGGITVKLNTGSGAHEVTLTNASLGKKLSGVYTVGSNENAQDLKVQTIVSQAVYDGKDSLLNSTGDITGTVTYPEEAVTNLSNARIDTSAPTNPEISFTTSKTNSQTPTTSLSVGDNFDFSGGLFKYSLNGGSSWCGPFAYANSTTNINITASACGGSGANGDKTVTVKFIDVAGNESSTAEASILFDNEKPILQTLTTDTATGVYGPGSAIKIVATYNEQIIDGSTLTIRLNNDVQLTLNTVENTNQLTGIYTVGITGSHEDKQSLVVASIQNQSVSDAASPANVQDSASLAGITENIDKDKTITIDTTAPDGLVTIDRSKDSSQIAINATDTNDQNMQVEINQPDYDDACDFSGSSWLTYQDTTSADLNENSDVARKVCIKLKDQVGNISPEIIALTPETPSGVQIDDISNNELNPPFYGAMFTWQDPILKGTSNGTSDAFEQYEIFRCHSSDSSDCTPDQQMGDPITDIQKNYYVDTGLTLDDHYCYRVRFRDAHGDYSQYSENTCFDAGHAPVITDSEVSIISGSLDDIRITNVTSTSANVIFQTRDSRYNRPVATKATISVYTSPDLKDSDLFLTTDEESEFSVMHSITINGLNSGTQYYLKITATDSSDPNNPGRTGELAYDPAGIPALTFTTLGKLTEIKIVNQPSIVTDTKAVVDFTTNQPAICFIDFKEASLANYNEINNSLENEARKNHSITISPLLPQTTYNYKITCQDAIDVTNIITKGATDQDALPSFTTLEEGVMSGGTSDKTPAEISNIALGSITGENVTVIWDTNKKTNSYAGYYLQSGDYMQFAGDRNVNLDVKNYSTAHTVTISGLIPDSKYALMIIATDASGNVSHSSEINFTTKQPSALSSVQVVSKALGQATVTWETGSNTTSIVEYGLTTAYGKTKQDSAMTKDHEIALADLVPGEEYHLRVKGEDVDKNLFASSDITFVPKAPPVISGFSVDSITEHEARVRFTTNVSTDALVSYANTANENDTGSQGKPNYFTKHEIILNELTSGATFSVKVKVRDEDGNETEETFSNFTTTEDTKPPVINNVKTDAALAQNDKVQTIISWTTDELTEGQVIYSEGRNGDENVFDQGAGVSLSHVAVITSFKPGVVYFFKVKASDVAGNEGISNQFTLLTPKQKQNIIQIIVGNFQDIFNWAKF